MTKRKHSGKHKKACMNQTERGFDEPLTGSLSWWLCLTTKQTVIHMSVLWPRFHLEQFHRGRWKQRSWRVGDLNPSRAWETVAINHEEKREKTTPCVRLNLKDGFIYVGCTSVFFFSFFQGVRGEWQWRIPINSLVTFPSSSVWVSVWVKPRHT